ncbi:MAG: long-chain-fatty-acid--CoA ligase [Candidatus Nephthysia bennettiae]|uniref:Long-chain fatty acid--CoA ligase n=1 Tax=Candidatus Nephthysia bennettiae TaxID=3127016 RepID=A0A934KDW5_9BACT|nr:long-chain fatty acid--CoA ligase [Candidatus Dormibacteraeota bacterium]MBJ7612248.1 long-chain fatty acid--CoA ligase [Candidatus Dormibacteraeota bacterium]PZR88009.1 MAG: long-chain-fatty-acid--CoA ligase [Candidatus Dormibacteraeota bacterium]
MSLNLAVMLRESARARPGKTALILDQLRLTYAQLEGATNQVAGRLVAEGLKPGDRVGIMLPNVPQFPIAYFGVLKAGGVVVPINVLLKAPEVQFYLGDSGARFLITWDDFADEALKGAAPLEGVRTFAALRPGGAPPEGARDFAELMQGPPGFEMAPTSPEDTAVILYTSGTTGRPKGAELSHLNLFMCAEVGATRLVAYAEDDVAMAVLPLFHSFGQSSVMNTTFYAGGTITLVPRFDPVKVLEVMERDRVTIFAGVPTMYFALLNHPERRRFDTSSLRLCVSGGAAMPGEVMTAFEQAFGVTVLEGYGLSETSPTASFNRSKEERRFMSVGKPIWGVEMNVFDDQDRELPPGREQVGEIVIRGHNVMKGYFKNPEATAEALRGGWFHSGDMGYLDEDGYFFIVDRKKELIIRGGFNVYPREVEEVLYAHPAVAAAAVIGAPDDRLGEEIKAVVQLKSGQTANPEELIAFCKERMAAYKYPRTVQLVDQLPVGPTGKILKKELKATLAASK